MKHQSNIYSKRGTLGGYKTLLLLLCATALVSFSANTPSTGKWHVKREAITFHYVLNERLITKESTSPLFGLDQEFVTVRKIYSQSKFSETRLFTGDGKKSILYKIENEIWYYKNNNKWELFYNPDKKIGGEISLFGLKYKVRFNGVVNVRNTTLHSISLLPLLVSQSHSLEYYFNPLKGVVIIKSSNGNILLRADNFNNPLTEAEIDILNYKTCL